MIKTEKPNLIGLIFVVVAFAIFALARVASTSDQNLIYKTTEDAMHRYNLKVRAGATPALSVEEALETVRKEVNDSEKIDKRLIELSGGELQYKPLWAQKQAETE